MTPTLTDQIGAMGVVDKLRFESRRVQDYMNTAEQKALLVEKIAAGYKAEGTDVSPAVIQEGVEQWYQNRLAFRASHLPWYFRAYIIRDRWLKPAVMTFASVCALVVAGMIFSTVRHQNALEQSSIAVSAALTRVVQPREPEIQFQESSSQYPFLLETAIALEKNTQALNALEQRIRKETEAKRAEIEQSIVPDLSELNRWLQEYGAAEAQQDALIKGAAEFKALLADFDLLKSNSAILAITPLDTLAARTGDLLQKPGLNLTEAREAVFALKSKLDTAAKVRHLKSEVAELAKRSMQQLRNKEDRNQLRTLVSRINLATANLNLPTNDDVEQLRSIEALSRTQVRLVVNPDNTQKTGVEREFSGSGGKAWYIIAQPLDDTQTPVRLRIRSIETDRESFTNLFGVRVSKEHYERVKQDKMDDGIVNNKLIGVKPVGQLSFLFEPEFSPEYITEW